MTAAEALRVDVVIDDLAGAEETESQRRQSVDELFARLRAETGVLPEPAAAPEGTDGLTATPAEPGAPSPDRPAGGDAPAPRRGSDQKSAAPGPGDSPPRRSPARTGAAPRPDAAAPGAAAAKTPTVKVIDADKPAAPAPDASVEAVAAEADAEATAVDPIIAQRDEVLTPVVAGLARRLKRALQDDQNDILDRLRAKGGWAPGVLPSEEEHAQRYLAAVSDQLLEAARAGATFGGGKADDAPGVDDVAADLASRIITPMRRRLEGEGPSVEAGDEPALVELVGAAFREWKGARTERLAADQAVLAFSRAAMKAVPRGSALRWVVNDDAAECPDCDDNALAGPVPAGDAYPTGHPHPPAHAGCRCLLTPANA